MTFAAGKNKKVKTDLQVTEYPGNEYYQWDAQQHYWAGYEWDGTNPTQPTSNGATNSADAPQSTATTSAHTPRDFNDMHSYTDVTGTAPAVLPTTSHFQAIPNANELLWYAVDGEPHWDNTTLWATMGHLYVGGMWFKKKSKISNYSANQSPNGVDYTRTTGAAAYIQYTIIRSKPSNLSDYFYLPALGQYESGTLSIGGVGYYWSSTPFPGGTSTAYGLNFDNLGVHVGNWARYSGHRLWTAQ